MSLVEHRRQNSSNIPASAKEFTATKTKTPNNASSVRCTVNPSYLSRRRALDSDEILAVYHDQDASLRSVFDKYCKASDKAGAPAALGVLLNIAEFRMILKDSGLLGGNNKVGFWNANK